MKRTGVMFSMGFLDVLTIAFIVLKLTGYVSWPWLWVLSPLWIPLALWLAFVLLVVIAAQCN